jgi:hypothetical protein
MISNKNAQVTIFIIVAIIIVAVIIFAFFYSDNIGFSSSPAQNPEAYLKNCISNSIKQSEEIILKTNGYPQLNSDNYMLYSKEKIPYLCTVSEFYSPCIPQEPAFFNYIRKLMENKIAMDTEACLTALKKDLDRKGFNVKEDPGQVNLAIEKDFIFVKLSKKIYASRAEDSLAIAGVEVSYGTNLYDLIKLEQTIVNYESTLCEFNAMNWMRFDPSIIIDMTRTSDSTKVYTLQDRLTDRKIKFAIKTCVLPAGI